VHNGLERLEKETRVADLMDENRTTDVQE